MTRYVCVIAALAATIGAQPIHVTAVEPLKKDPVLAVAAQEAVQLSDKWTAGDNHPAVGPDGRVVYAFGSGLPIVVCAPLRVCIIELQAGEKISGEPLIGDSVRWELKPSVFGSGAAETNVIVLKPQESGLDTNLLITTDRRAYYVRLVSKETDYVARTAFKYAEDDNSGAWRKRMEQQRQEERRPDDRPALLPAMATAEKLNFGYAVTGSENIKPRRVFDDDQKTYIQMPDAMRTREAPVLQVIGADGKGEVVNYRVDDKGRFLTYVVDRLADRFVLLNGKGKHAEKVDIRRESKERS